jgi:hypothetical protein
MSSLTIDGGVGGFYTPVGVTCFGTLPVGMARRPGRMGAACTPGVRVIDKGGLWTRSGAVCAGGRGYTFDGG